MREMFRPTIKLEECTDFYIENKNEKIMEQELGNIEKNSKMKTIREFFERKNIFKNKKNRENEPNNLEYEINPVSLEMNSIQLDLTYVKIENTINSNIPIVNSNSQDSLKFNQNLESTPYIFNNPFYETNSNFNNLFTENTDIAETTITDPTGIDDMTDLDDSDLSSEGGEGFLKRIKVESQKLFTWEQNTKESMMQNIHQFSSKIQNQASVLQAKFQSAKFPMHYKNHNVKEVLQNIKKIQKEKIQLAVRDLENRFQNIPVGLPRKRARFDEEIPSISPIEQEKSIRTASPSKISFNWKNPKFTFEPNQSSNNSISNLANEQESKNHRFLSNKFLFRKEKSASNSPRNISTHESIYPSNVIIPFDPSHTNTYNTTHTTNTDFNIAPPPPPKFEIPCFFKEEASMSHNGQPSSLSNQNISSSSQFDTFNNFSNMQIDIQNIQQNNYQQIPATHRIKQNPFHSIRKRFQSENDSQGKHFYNKIFTGHKHPESNEMEIESNQTSPENIKTGAWSKDEHAAFLSGYNQFGRQWNKIAALIPSRTRRQIISHAQKFLRKETNQSSDASLANHSFTQCKESK